MEIDYKLLRNICLANIRDFEKLGEVSNTPDGIYIHIKSGKSKVLGVAHLDTVLNSKHFQVIQKKKDTRVYNMQLDDRLGAYILLDLLPKLNIDCDILLTEGEEMGMSTAQHFDIKDYNWIFSFDRHGEDAVLYQYQENKKDKWETSLTDSKFKIGLGSFSDIAFMEHLGIKGVNIGTGYEGEHTKSCYFSKNALNRQLIKFKDFYERNKNIKYLHVEKPRIYNTNWDYGITKYNPYYDSDTLACFFCEEGIGINPIMGIYLCDECFSTSIICASCGDIFPDTEIMDGRCHDCNHYNLIVNRQGD